MSLQDEVDELCTGVDCHLLLQIIGEDNESAVELVQKISKYPRLCKLERHLWETYMLRAVDAPSYPYTYFKTLRKCLLSKLERLPCP